MHRGGVPFVSPKIFREIYWATVRPIIEELWADGHQTLFYAEGSWDRHLESFAELPEHSIVYHVDRGDMARTHDILGSKFCLSGGLSNVLLATGTPADIERECQRLLDIAARNGGFIMDSSAIVQNDAKVENVRAMTDFTRAHGVYDDQAASTDDPGPVARHWIPGNAPPRPTARGGNAPGVCDPYERLAATLPPMTGDPALVRRVWEGVDSLAYTFIWQVLLSF
jgi:hypothetical protein